MTHQDDGDPLLVRPYLGEGAESHAPTWPTPPAAPVDAPTVALPTIAKRTGRVRHRRRLLALGALVAALAVAGGVIGLGALLRTGDSREPQAFTDVSLPPWSRAATDTPSIPDGPRGEPGSGSGVGSGVGSGTTSGDEAGGEDGTRATPKETGKPSGAPSTAAPSTSVSPSSGADEPLGVRTGAVVGPGGLCLDLNGGVAIDGNHVQVFGCNGTAAQVWTLAADGTLQVLGKCARASRRSEVRIGDCGQRRGNAGWRIDADGTMVYAATGACLTDRSNGSRPGAGVRLDACAGNASQRWRFS